ncbi:MULTISPECIES: DUF6624 domain-containing protein [Kitasatospora]|uniref:DUF222 domain-containing protein n=1 Tax=Kitasatospora cystarginea TaxID=58350 RepID=A0ABP5QQH1_9ACTN
MTQRQTPPAPAELAELAAELTAMAAADHAAVTTAHSPDLAEQLTWRRLTARHGERLDEIMDAYGWPTADLVGPEAARAAWLIAQHSDRRTDIQRRALELMTAAVQEGLADARDLAFLHDRTLVNEGRPQIYGTQIGAVVDGAPVPWPCEQPDRMDELRAEVGIEPFALYTARHAPR